jgi:hypothetical protein
MIVATCDFCHRHASVSALGFIEAKTTSLWQRFLSIRSSPRGFVGDVTNTALLTRSAVETERSARLILANFLAMTGLNWKAELSALKLSSTVNQQHESQAH